MTPTFDEMTLREFRARCPFKPGDQVRVNPRAMTAYATARIMSWPWYDPVKDETFVMVSVPPSYKLDEIPCSLLVRPMTLEELQRTRLYTIVPLKRACDSAVDVDDTGFTYLNGTAWVALDGDTKEFWTVLYSDEKRSLSLGVVEQALLEKINEDM